MKPPEPFENYLKRGTVRKIAPDKARAEFLVNESDTSFKGLKERLGDRDINENNANSIIKDCHDIIIEIIRARMLIDGYMASGLNAHEAEVSYMKNVGFNDKDVSFVNELRYFRNSATYYGKILDTGYAKKVVDFLINNHHNIRRIVNL
ncbi:MAG: hypothetical protein WCK90_05625 [archaeon]